MSGRLDDQESERLRTPPSERFEGPSHMFSLQGALDELRAEDHPARAGHRQVTLFHRGEITHVLFAFEPGGRLEKHTAQGAVTLHVLEGHLSVQADGTEYELPEGSLLVLDSDVPHDVWASVSSAMLLTVHLDRKS